jgi:hypothetical protein
MWGIVWFVGLSVLVGCISRQSLRWLSEPDPVLKFLCSVFVSFLVLVCVKLASIPILKGTLCTTVTTATDESPMVRLERDAQKYRLVTREKDSVRVQYVGDIRFRSREPADKPTVRVTTKYWVAPSWIPDWVLIVTDTPRNNPFSVSAEITAPEGRLDEILQQL